MFYTCTMMIISLVTSVLQEHSNYYLAITGSLRCLLTSSNMFLLATSVLALNLLDIWNMANSFHYQFHRAPGKELPVIISSIYLSLMALMLSSYSSIDSQKWYI